ncbi:hypothetical protein Tco_0063390, partial [Tanacetum coccineum]
MRVLHFYLPQANANNHDRFVPPLSFLNMVPFYKQQLGFIIELKASSSFKTTGLLQPWQTLCKIFSKCLTTRVTGWDQLPLQIMMYAEVFGLDVPLTQSQPIESTQGTHRTPSALRSPSPKTNIAESSVIHFRLLERRSTRLTPPALVPTVEKANEMILQDILQV